MRNPVCKHYAVQGCHRDIQILKNKYPLSTIDFFDNFVTTMLLVVDNCFFHQGDSLVRRADIASKGRSSATEKKNNSDDKPLKQRFHGIPLNDFSERPPVAPGRERARTWPAVASI